jgi:hypothetical protein
MTKPPIVMGPKRIAKSSVGFGALVVFCGASAFGSATNAVCEKHAVQLRGEQIPVARPRGFVDICEDKASPACQGLTNGYPKSVTTLAYFVPSAEWSKTDSNQQRRGFSTYYIAQIHNESRPQDFFDIRQRIALANGKIADTSRLSESLGKAESTQLGILDETPSSITIGVVMKITPANKTRQKPVLLVATNAVALVEKHIFSLYFYDAYQGPESVEDARKRTRQWLDCFAARKSIR